MQVTYKYELESSPVTKEVWEFYEDFFDNKFEAFLQGRVMLLISADLGNRNTILQLDFDYKRNEIQNPDEYCKEIFQLLNKSFEPNSFNLELTPGGCHIVSNFYFKRLTSEIPQLKKLVRQFFIGVKNLDFHASLSKTPMRRIGFDAKRSFFMIPYENPDHNIRLRLQKSDPVYDKDFWINYIENNLIPKKEISFSTLTENLKRFSSLVLDETHFKVIDCIIVKHDAKKAGTHYDLRLETLNEQYQSWVLKSEGDLLIPYLTGPQLKIVETNIHTKKEAEFTGFIKSGYGAGWIKLYSRSSVLLIKNIEKKQITIKHLDGKFKDEIWQLIFLDNGIWSLSTETI